MHKKECRQRLINFTVPIRKTKQKNQTSFNFVDNWDNQTSHIWVTIKTFISKGIYYLYHCNHKKKEYKNFHQRRSRVNISCKLHHSKSQPATLSNQHFGSEAVAFEWTYADTSQIAKKKKRKRKKKWTGNKKLIIIVCKFSMTFEPHSSLPENIEFYSHETGPYLL